VGIAEPMGQGPALQEPLMLQKYGSMPASLHTLPSLIRQLPKGGQTMGVALLSKAPNNASIICRAVQGSHNLPCARLLPHIAAAALGMLRRILQRVKRARIARGAKCAHSKGCKVCKLQRVQSVHIAEGAKFEHCKGWKVPFM